MTKVEWVKLELDLRCFDSNRFTTSLPAEIRVMTLPDLGDVDRRRRQIYQLNKECAADIPDRGEFFTWAEYKRIRFDVPQFRPDGRLLAVAGDGGPLPGVAAPRGDVGLR